MSKKTTSTAISQHSLFGPPPILEGEDAAAYDELFGRVCAAIKPIDVIDEMFISDVVVLEWEVLRLRRYKLSLTESTDLRHSRTFCVRSSNTVCTGSALPRNLRQSSKTILRKIRTKTSRRLWRTRVPGMNGCRRQGQRGAGRHWSEHG